jgi:hypothetical protein
LRVPDLRADELVSSHTHTSHTCLGAWPVCESRPDPEAPLFYAQLFALSVNAGNPLCKGPSAPLTWDAAPLGGRKSQGVETLRRRDGAEQPAGPGFAKVVRGRATPSAVSWGHNQRSPGLRRPGVRELFLELGGRACEPGRGPERRAHRSTWQWQRHSRPEAQVLGGERFGACECLCHLPGLADPRPPPAGARGGTWGARTPTRIGASTRRPGGRPFADGTLSSTCALFRTVS